MPPGRTQLRRETSDHPFVGFDPHAHHPTIERSRRPAGGFYDMLRLGRPVGCPTRAL